NSIWLGGGSHSFKTDLKGKVVLVDFWEYTCINCIRTFPHLKELYRRYHKYGFEIIGVHKGEFAFASIAANVEAAYKRFKLPYPGIADVNDKVWNEYNCNTWPDSYLVDGSGVIRLNHQGEGNYGELEMQIQKLLKQIHPELNFSNYRIPPDIDLFSKGCGKQSDEIYIGYERGGLWGGKIANSEGFKDDKIVFYKPTTKRVQRGFFVQGKWHNGPDSFTSVSSSSSKDIVSLGITYYGRDVYSVLGDKEKHPVDIIVTRDGKPVPKSMCGKDMRINKEGETYIRIFEPRMYYIITKENANKHELKFFPAEAGVSIYSFTFGNKCLENFDRL
ncbi:MAG TPA: redoxin domain-containing protein, partial [Ignavibacteriaceae bacterium]|nr:redoxin domain-containing protein [Ignavibacteriaceae bacterium]